MQEVRGVRPNLRRAGPLVLVLVLASLAVTPTLRAQVTGVIRGTIVDQAGDPVIGADVTIVLQEDPPRTFSTTTNATGEYSQIGLPSGSYRVTATTAGLTGQTVDVRVRIGLTTEMDFRLAPEPGDLRSAEMEVEDAESAAVRAAFGAGVAAAGESRHGEAIGYFEEALALLPNCYQCYYAIGIEQSKLAAYEEAEAAFTKALEIKADYADPYNGLAALYNTQRRFDEAQAASAKAAELSAGPAGQATGTDTENATFNQALILWNATRVPEAKAKLLEVLALNPDHAEAHYWLGMANLNEQAPEEAARMFQRYLELDPDGQYAAQAKGILSQVQPQ
jgi:Tfp pilus assembly protein PilF